MLLGPAIAGVLFTALTSGLRDVFARLIRWRVAPGWYLVALLTAPAVYTLVLGALSLGSPAYLPGIVTTTSDWPSFLLLGTAPGLLVGFLEELGWTGCAIPRLRMRHGVAATGLIAGVIWGAWHLLTNDVWAAAVGAGSLPIAAYATLNGVVMLVGQLPAYRLLMVWAYDRTGSLFLAILMHASLVFSTFVLGPIGLVGAPSLVYPIGVGAGMWCVVGAVFGLDKRGAKARPQA
jgi:membrane protease YdiL (CAAX protease family)